ncbi:MAG: redox-regulated ATPase YchF [Candidatus Ranarchaeia archaeon]
MLVGIVGKPSAGKSTFLNAACLTDAKVGNYPFTTVEPNKGVSYVSIKCACKELDVQCDPQNSLCLDGIRLIPINLLDVPGLVPEAHKGKGLGNKFMDALFRASGLIHVVDISGSLDSEGREVELGKWDPLNDIEFLERETTLWLYGIIERNWRQIIGKLKAEKTPLQNLLAEKISGLGITKNHIKKAITDANLNVQNSFKWDSGQRIQFTSKLLQVSKPTIIAANKIDRETAEKNLEKVKEVYNGDVIPCSALGEFALRKLAESKIIEYRPGDPDFKYIKEAKITDKTKKKLDKLKETVLQKYTNTGIQSVLDHMVFKKLNMISVFPVEDVSTFSNHNGQVLPDTLLITKGSTAKDLAYKIHSDLGDTFIHAIDARTKRRLGESYEIKDGDIIKIVAASGRK